jgi:hypothetical protein
VCGQFTQHASWQEVHAFSQPLVTPKPDELVVSTPMRPAYIMNLDGEGRRLSNVSPRARVPASS